jgi:hypothetical protein
MQAVITTGITASAQPETDNLSVVDFGVGKVMFFTEIVGLQGQTLAHQWLFEDKVVASIALTMASGRSINWSQTSIDSNQVGSWTAQVVDGKGQVLASRGFEVIGTSQGVQEVVQKRVDDRCSDRVAELEGQVAANPGVEYYKFLFDQQVKRCAQ